MKRSVARASPARVPARTLARRRATAPCLARRRRGKTVAQPKTVRLVQAIRIKLINFKRVFITVLDYPEDAITIFVGPVCVLAIPPIIQVLSYKIVTVALHKRSCVLTRIYLPHSKIKC